MNRVWTALALVGLMAPATWLGRGPTSHEGKKGDFSLFTTEGGPGVGTDFVTCKTNKKLAVLYMTFTNLDPDTKQIQLIFEDGDSVPVFVPEGTSLSVAQTIGTNPGIDNEIKIDPLDQDGDVNPMVGWASIRREDGSKVLCTGTLLP